MTVTETPTETQPVVPSFGDAQTDRKLAIICSKGNRTWPTRP